MEESEVSLGPLKLRALRGKGEKGPEEARRRGVASSGHASLSSAGFLPFPLKRASLERTVPSLP